MAGEDMWFNGRSFPGSVGGGDNNGGCFGNPNIPFSGFSLPVSGIQSSGSGFSNSFSRQKNNFGSFFDPNSSSSSSSSGVANQEVGFKKIKLADFNYGSTTHHPIFQEGEGSMSENRQPLGLSLRKTDSFVNLVDERLAEKKRNSTKLNQRKNDLNRNRIQPKSDNFVLPSSSDKLKATNFPILMLQIGSWEKDSRFEGQLVAKCYYSKKKLVWEILEGSLKKKIELKWSQISALGIACVDNDPVILKLELMKPPEFYGESNPQPRKHTIWQRINDFTGGQASTYRTHFLKFPPGVLGKQYEKLLQCDSRLYALSMHPLPNSSNLFFPPDNKNEVDFGNRQKPEVDPRLLLPHSVNQMFLAPAEPLQASVQPPLIWDSTSPISVMEFASLDENGHKHGAETENPRRQGVSMMTGNTEIQQIPYIVPTIQANQDFGWQGCQMTNLYSQQVHPGDVTRAEELIRPASEMGFWEELLRDENVLESETRTELGTIGNQFLTLLELQRPSPDFLSQTINTGFGQEILLKQQFPGLIENQQLNSVPQLAGENQMKQFEGNNNYNYIASQLLNDKELMQHSINRPGSSYPNIFSGMQRDDFHNIN